MKIKYTARTFEHLGDSNHDHELGHPYFLKTEDMVAIQNRHTARPDDVYVATFPKCGTTWTIAIVEHLLGKVSQRIGGGSSQEEPVPWLEAAFAVWGRKMSGSYDSVITLLESKESPRYFKTHSSVGLLKQPETGKIRLIQTTRHPLDAFVSMWHHLSRDPKFEFTMKFSDYFQNVCLQSKTVGGGFFEFHEEYLQAAKNGEIEALFLKFAKMKSVHGAKAGVHDMAKFMGIEKYDVDAIVLATSFSSMKKKQAEKGFGSGMETKGESGISGSKDKVASDHIRQGSVGGWKDYYTAEDMRLWKTYLVENLGKFPCCEEYFGKDILMTDVPEPVE